MVKPTAKMNVPFGSFPGFRLKMASGQAMSSLSKVMEKHELRVVDATTLSLIHSNPGCRQRAVGDTLNIVSANLTPLISRLEKRGLLIRKPIDGRTNGLYLTASGTKLAKRALKDMDKYEQEMIKKVPEELRENFVKALSYLS